MRFWHELRPHNGRHDLSDIVIFDPNAHEPLDTEPWNETEARAFVLRIAREADDAYGEMQAWPMHPEDDGDDGETASGIYFGGAGTMWALTHLAKSNRLELRNDYRAGIARCEQTYRERPTETETVVPSYFLGTVGIMTARFAITGERDVLDRIAADMRANAGNPVREALWGSPGTALAGILVREREGDARYDDILRAVHDELFATWESPEADACFLWEQDLYGQRRHLVGAAHGAVGNLVPLVRAIDLLSGVAVYVDAVLRRDPALLTIDIM